MKPRRTATTLLVLAAALAAAAGSARAGTAAVVTHAAAVTRATTVLGAQTSSNWAGYAVSGVDPATNTPTAYSNVSGSWVQPAATCGVSTGRTYSAFWVGLGGLADSSPALEQVGTESDCTAAGKATYSVWYELVPAPPVTINLAVKPGDAISANVAVNGQNVTMTISNTTRGTTFTETLQAAATDVSSAEWVAEAPSACGNHGGCRPLPLTNFGNATFTSASATGDGHVGTISDPAWNATAITLEGVAGNLFRGRFAAAVPTANATPGALSSDGSSFAVAWSQATAPTVAQSGGYPGGGYPGPGWGGWGRGWHR